MIARQSKVRLLLDEGLPKRQTFPVLNDRTNLVHIKHDCGFGGIADDKLYVFASLEQRLVVTFNVRDFRILIRRAGPSIIGISQHLSVGQIDRKLSALIRRLKPHHLLNHFFKIDRDTLVKDLVR